jgi:type I restriction-modification system DNA methylase subunit
MAENKDIIKETVEKRLKEAQKNKEFKQEFDIGGFNAFTDIREAEYTEIKSKETNINNDKNNNEMPEMIREPQEIEEGKQPTQKILNYQTDNKDLMNIISLVNKNVQYRDIEGYIQSMAGDSNKSRRNDLAFAITKQKMPLAKTGMYSIISIVNDFIKSNIENANTTNGFENVIPLSGNKKAANQPIVEEETPFTDVEEIDNNKTEMKEDKETFEKEGSQTGKGKLYEFFTPQVVADKMVALAQHYGFKGGNVLEPAAGNGRLLKHLKGCNITAFEINPSNYEALKKEFPNADLHNYSFEKSFLQEPRFNKLIESTASKTWLKNAPFDLVLANPPYGKFSGLYSSYFPSTAEQYEHFFIIQSLKLLKSGGIGVYLIPSSFMRNGINYNTIKEKIFKIAKLTDAYRLPSNIFKDTQIGTDIIILTKL